MIKKQQRWIALLVALTFAWLLQVSAMPVAAAGTTEQISAANAEQGPGTIEEEGDGGFVAKKKSILPYVLIGVGVIAVAAVLFLVVLKTSYDIRGNWNVRRITSAGTIDFTVTFTGEKASGTFEANQYGDLLNGTYTANGKNVEWIFESSSKYTGTFSDKDAMGGSYLKYDGTTTGTWTATRATTAAVRPVTQSLNGKQDID
jgi:hypothetical protein